jgi:hypothetical protein
VVVADGTVVEVGMVATVVVDAPRAVVEVAKGSGGAGLKTTPGEGVATGACGAGAVVVVAGAVAVVVAVRAWVVVVIVELEVVGSGTVEVVVEAGPVLGVIDGNGTVAPGRARAASPGAARGVLSRVVAATTRPRATRPTTPNRSVLLLTVLLLAYHHEWICSGTPGRPKPARFAIDRENASRPGRRRREPAG